MGAFDDAIREHLELKRQQGASEDELKQQEEEALGRGAPRFQRPPEEQPPGSSDETAEAARAALAEPDELAIEEPDELAIEEPEQPGALPAPEDELEPDEVLPDESLESSVEEDVLEETPDFLEKSPEQDRLWFEQRAPKDFDFGD